MGTGWFLMEAVYAAIFSSEVIIKCFLLGVGNYFCGTDRLWNYLDVGITAITVFDVVAQVTESASEKGLKIATVLRTLRMLRVARLLKLLHSEYLKEMANMIAGLLIGVPWMCWVFVLLGFVVYVCGLVFRLAVGPGEGISYVAKCGDGDGLVVPPVDPDCSRHNVYGEQYFGTLEIAIVTVFRCMIGDCTTRGGQSIVSWMGYGYGWKWYVPYIVGMTAVLFGFFNVITALFVESTLQGLKYNDAQRKYASLYASRYTRRKLEELVEKIKEVRASMGCNDVAGPMSHSEFIHIVEHEQVKTLMDDLDVSSASLTHHGDLFSIFDSAGVGTVTMVQFVETIVQMRGEPHKCDMVATRLALQALRVKVQNFQFLTVVNHKALLHAFADLTNKTPLSLFQVEKKS